jgi:hypothetical protein
MKLVNRYNTMMRIFALMLLLQGCAVSQAVVEVALPDNTRHGLRDYDPCVRCGESMVTYIHIEEDRDLWQLEEPDE